MESNDKESLTNDKESLINNEDEKQEFTNIDLINANIVNPQDNSVVAKAGKTDIKVSDLPSSWNMGDTRRKQAIAFSLRDVSTKHGMYSSIPMICRADECPYNQFCSPYQSGMVVRGERCVKEIGEILESSQRYYNELVIDPQDPDSRVDAAQVAMLVSLEVIMRRCEMLLAKGDIVELVETAIDPRSGESVMQPQLHKAAEALPKLQRRHSEILKDLHATRREKSATTGVDSMSIDKYTKELLARSIMADQRISLMREGKISEAAALGPAMVEELEPEDSIDADFKTKD